MEKKLIVLIADDEKFFAKSILDVVEKNTKVEKVYVASNGLDELDIILGYEPDIVFTDMQMPEMTGLDVIRNISNRDLEKKPKFILVTSDRSADLVIASRNLKFDITYKPIDANTINEYIDDYTEEKVEIPKKETEKNNKEGFFSKLFKRK